MYSKKKVGKKLVQAGFELVCALILLGNIWTVAWLWFLCFDKDIFTYNSATEVELKSSGFVNFINAPICWSLNYVCSMFWSWVWIIYSNNKTCICQFFNNIIITFRYMYVCIWISSTYSQASWSGVRPLLSVHRAEHPCTSMRYFTIFSLPYLQV